MTKPNRKELIKRLEKAKKDIKSIKNKRKKFTFFSGD